jgi:hypothetical protein
MASPSSEADWTDHQLVEHCQAWEEFAWQELDRRFHAGLVRFCHGSLLRQRIADWNLAEDMAEQILSSLCEHDCRRLRSCLGKGCSLFTHLMNLTRSELYRFCCARRKRQGKEKVVAPESLQEARDPHPTAPQAAEARAAQPERARPALTPSERKLLEFQLNHPGEVSPDYTPSTFASMMSRIKKKFPPG